MSGFSPEWLALREPVDHRSRDGEVAEQLRAHFADRASIRIVDLGCGTGSNLRGTYHLLPQQQHWTLVDYDPRLLEAAREAIAAWADKREDTPSGGISIVKNGKELNVELLRADLNADLDGALGAAPDLVTASAFFDLCSPAFIGHLAASVAQRRAVFFTVLTFNGQQDWSPRHPVDRRMLAAFNEHQAGDKGFGPAAGPAAAPSLGATFQAAGYEVHEGDSPWRLGVEDQRLIGELSKGFAQAVAETGTLDAPTVASWSEVVRTGAVVGHTDTLAIPARG